MNEQEDHAQEFFVDYYILDDNEVARIRITCDPVEGEHLSGEILSGDGCWKEYAPSAIIGEGELVSRSEAKKCAKKLGLRL